VLVRQESGENKEFVIYSVKKRRGEMRCKTRRRVYRGRMAFKERKKEQLCGIRGKRLAGEQKGAPNGRNRKGSCSKARGVGVGNQRERMEKNGGGLSTISESWKGLDVFIFNVRGRSNSTILWERGSRDVKL